MEYTHLTKEQQQAIVEKRIADIEVQHYDTTVSKQIAEAEMKRRNGTEQVALQAQIDVLGVQLNQLERARQDLLELC